jgi:tetratricopeptide (TPR) repeat protein
LWFLAITHTSVGEAAEADSVLDLMEGFGSKLTPYWRAYMEWLQAGVRSDRERGLEAIRRAAQMAPGSRAVFNLAQSYTNQNRPREAVETLRTLDPERGAMRGWIIYWYFLTQALHMLGEHGQELTAATRATQLHPNLPDGLYLKGRALAALGRIEELRAVIAALVNQGSGYAGYYMIDFARVLKVRGYADEAQDILERSIEWLEERPAEEATTLNHRLRLGRAQFAAGRHGDARQTLDAVVEHYPDAVEGRGYRGFVAATARDSTQASADLEWLEHPQGPYARSIYTFWRAVINGAWGRSNDAVDLLRQAYSEGLDLPSYLPWHSSFFDPLRDHPGFLEFMRPKG